MALLNHTKIEIAPKPSSGEPTGWKTLLACTNLPDMGSDPEFVETTTIDDSTGTNELGTGSASDIVYTFRYRTVGEGSGVDEIKPAFETLSELVPIINSENLYVVKNTFKSGLVVEFDVSGVSLKLLGGGVNDVSNFEASFGLASEFTFTQPGN